MQTYITSLLSEVLFQINLYTDNARSAFISMLIIYYRRLFYSENKFNIHIRRESQSNFVNTVYVSRTRCFGTRSLFHSSTIPIWFAIKIIWKRRDVWFVACVYFRHQIIVCVNQTVYALLYYYETMRPFCRWNFCLFFVDKFVTWLNMAFFSRPLKYTFTMLAESSLFFWFRSRLSRESPPSQRQRAQTCGFHVVQPYGASVSQLLVVFDGVGASSGMLCDRSDAPRHHV